MTVDSGEQIWEDVDLRATVSQDDELSCYIYDYCRHLDHSEETEKLIQDTKMKLDPNANGKENDVFNIDYVVKGGGNVATTHST